ncbi:MAG: hypothetical protein R6X16_17120 [Anaerolineae bacterium]
MKHRLILASALLITAALLAGTLCGCGARLPVEEPTSEIDTVVVPTSPPDTPSATAAPTHTVAPTATAAATAPAAEAGLYVPDLNDLAAQTYDGWQSYENAAYGFALRYPEGWTLTEVTERGDTMAGHRVDLVDDADPNNRMHLAYRRADEDVQILPTGMSQGEIVERGAIVFLGEALSRQSLVDRAEDSRILYGGGGEIVRDGLVFWMDLYRLAEGDAERGLSEEVQWVADAILSSLTLSAR